MDDNISKKRSIGLLKGIGIIGWKPLQYLACHKRCLNVASVILIIFSVLNYLDLPVKADKEGLGDLWSPGQELIEETAGSFGNGIMGGAASMLVSIIPAAQANVDFSADDALENQDFAVMENNGLLSPGIFSNPFSGMKKEQVIYEVREGDSPFSIAIKFGVNTDTVLSANNLRDGDYIKPGQELVILPINGLRVKIAKGDTISSLAKKYKGEEAEIEVFNGIYDDGKLIAGEFIIIPDGQLPAAPKPKVTAPRYSSQSQISGGWLIYPTTGRDWGVVHGQNGVDVANACGTPIYAAAAGAVMLSDSVGWNYGYGKYIMIRHPNGVVTVYSHASRLLVGAGEQVSQGQLIALMGTTGRSTGCHLHFEVRGARNPLAGAKTIR